MYLDFLVKVPTVKGKITRRKKSNVVEEHWGQVHESRDKSFVKLL